MIEIISVVIILSIMAAIAVPRLMSVSTEASKAMTESVAVTLGAASARNYSVRVEVVTRGAAIANCNEISSLVPGWGTRYASYTITNTPIPALTTVECTVTGSESQTAQFTGHGIN